MTKDEFRTWRRRLNLTQAQVGQRLDKSTRQINAYEGGQAEIPRAVELALQQIERDVEYEYRRAARNA